MIKITSTHSFFFTTGASSGDSHLFGDSQPQDSNTGCCSMQLKTGVQIICTFYAILSSLILVSYYATLEKAITDKYILYFGSKSQYDQYQQQYTSNPSNPNYDKPDTTFIEVWNFQRKFHWKFQKNVDIISFYKYQYFVDLIPESNSRGHHHWHSY